MQVSLNKTYKTPLGVNNDEIVIGNDKNHLSFEPHISISGWNKENTLGIKYNKTYAALPALTQDNVSISDINDEFYVYSVDNNLKFGLIFKKKPSKNTITFQLEGWQEFNFFYQPALNKEIYPGIRKSFNIVLVSETEAIDDKGKVIVHRPEDVVGSYAVYHKSKRDHILGNTNYKTGKFGHFYRPKFIDANNKYVWADLNIKDGVYTVTISQEFLDNAVYPVRANDTFGKIDGYGASYENQINYPQIMKSPTLPAYRGTLVSLSLYGRKYSGTPSFLPALYSDVSGTPTARLAALESGGVLMSAGDSWNTASLVADIVAGTQYWLGDKADKDVYREYYDSGVIANDYIAFAVPYPNPWVVSNMGLGGHSIYATYTKKNTGPLPMYFRPV